MNISIKQEGFWSAKCVPVVCDRGAMDKQLLDRIRTLFNELLERGRENREAKYFAKKYNKNFKSKVTTESYMGSSNCRVCHALNGSETLVFYPDNAPNEEWHVPSGYLHYLQEHSVHASDEFVYALLNTSVPQHSEEVDCTLFRLMEHQKGYGALVFSD